MNIQAKLMAVMPRRKEIAYLVLGVLMAAGLGTVAQVASAPSPTCDIAKAAQFAIDSNLKLINSATVNPGKFFAPGGSDSCVSDSMLQSFDLSSAIPDPWGLLSSGIESMISSKITSTSSKVCNAINGNMPSLAMNMNQAIGDINNSLGSGGNFANLLSSDLGFTTFDPNVTNNLNGTGTYGPSSTTGGNAFSLSSTPGGSASSGSALSTSTNNSFLSSGAAANNAVVLAAQTQQANLAMQSSWSNYQAQASAGNGSAYYDAYLASVNSYNSAVKAELAAQSQTGFGQTQNAYSGLTTISPNPPITTNNTGTGVNVFSN